MKLRLMADYDCQPIWEMRSGGVRNVPIDGMEISFQLKHELRAWADCYNNTLNRDDPASSGFSSREAEEEFERTGRRLWRMLAMELGPEVAITYFSQIENRELVQ